MSDVLRMLKPLRQLLPARATYDVKNRVDKSVEGLQADWLNMYPSSKFLPYGEADVPRACMNRAIAHVLHDLFKLLHAAKMQEVGESPLDFGSRLIGYVVLDAEDWSLEFKGRFADLRDKNCLTNIYYIAKGYP